MNIFDWLKEIRTKKRPWDNFSVNDQKEFQPYMINRFLSMDKSLIALVDFFQKYSIGLLEPKDTYKWYCLIVPTGKKWFPYIKSKKSEQYPNWLINLVKKHYEVNKKDSIEYLNFFLNYKTKTAGRKVLKDLLLLYGTDLKLIQGGIKDE